MNDASRAPEAAGSASERRLERERAKRARDRRGLAIAAISTIVVIGGLTALVLTSSGWPAVRETFFNATIFKQSFPEVAEGFWLDVRLFIVVEVAVLAIGLLVALIRISSSPALFPVRLLGTIFVDVFRGIPTILLVYLVGFGIPALAQADPDGSGSALSWLPTNPIVLGAIALTLSYSAYVSEVYRAGLRSIDPGQRQAALAIGLTEVQSMRHVVLPQAVRRVGPPLLNDFIALQKDVALISIIGVSAEAFRIAQIQAASEFNYTPLLAAALCYMAVTIPLARLLDRWERGRVR